MTALQTSDQFISTILKTKFHNDKEKLIEAIKELFKKEFTKELREFNLLKAYENGELSIGQIAQYLDISKSEVLTLLEKYEIPFIDVDEEYLQNEINAFK